MPCASMSFRLKEAVRLLAFHTSTQPELRIRIPAEFWIHNKGFGSTNRVSDPPLGFRIHHQGSNQGFRSIISVADQPSGLRIRILPGFRIRTPTGLWIHHQGCGSTIRVSDPSLVLRILHQGC